MGAELEVRQSTFSKVADGGLIREGALKLGLTYPANKWDMLALKGNMFVGSTIAGTVMTNSAADAGGIVLTAPTLRFTVPSGLTVFPRRVNVAFFAMAGTVNEIAIIANNANSYTSGGAAWPRPPVNWRTDAPIASAVTNVYMASGSAITEAALTLSRALYVDELPVAFETVANSYRFDKVFDEFHPIVGPASFLVYIGAATTASSCHFLVEWAELNTSDVI